jgi:hypothetical protein
VSKSNEYKEQGKVASTSFSIRCARNRSSVLVEMENLLITWLEVCSQKRIPIGTIVTAEKEEIASEGEGVCLKGNFAKGTRADVSKFGNC